MKTSILTPIKLILLVMVFLLIQPMALAGAETEKITSEGVPTEDLPAAASGDGVDMFIPDIGGFTEALEQIDDYLAQQGVGPFLSRWFQELKSGQRGLNWQSLKDLGQGLFLQQIKAQGSWLGQVLILSAVCVLLEQLNRSVAGPGPAKAGQLVSLLLIMTLVLHSAGLALKGATGAIEGMAGFMEVLVPLLMAAMMSLGQVSTVMVMQPLVLGSMSFITGQIHYLLFPMIMIYLALVLANSLSEGLSVGKLAKFLKQTVQWGLGMSMTIFTAVLAVSGGFAAVADGISLRTAKYVAGNLVPVAGKLFADVLDTAAGAALILKNSIGLIGMIAIVALLIIPLVGIFLQAMLLKLVGAVVEPLGDSRTSGILDELGNVMMLIFTVLGAIGIMVILTLSAILLAGNTAIMMR